MGLALARLGVATRRVVVASATIGTVRRTVPIVDDQADFRASARALLEAEGFEVVGEAASASEAIREVARVRPEVVLLDVQLPDLDGFRVAERLAAAPGSPAVGFVSGREASADGPR